ncbi:hypothetical protein Vretimale_3144 [Volvox reticuliferus]|uniref:RING-type domain-containing protein n=1 Tax=Volvox reticuliferus TaxID=1737510 RepID=A0A8J4D858_9CHLO|nr:hypothetical protein Vretifemale_6632 [Volvox reticuliferus]GIL97618.1 hypothetical protein Vretimale_3144 [Volvox reticuliferus]
MSCVDIPVPSSPLVHSSTQLRDPGQHGVPIQGGSRPPAGLNPLAGDFDPGRSNNGIRQQAGGQGRGRGGGGGRGGLSSAMNRTGQQGHQQQQNPNRQASGDVASSPAASVPPVGTESSGGGGAAGMVGCGRDSSANNSSGGGSAGTATRSGSAATGGSGGRGSSVANANHLLNFQYESAAVRTASGRGGARGGSRPSGSTRSQGGGGGTTGVSSAARGRYGSAKPQKYDKNKFLQANFRFMVSDAIDASVYEADADKMFDWDDVLQVEMATATPVQCPISLDSPPLCPQITPCGHIFSFPAIMHHLVNHGGEQLRRSAPCPLCFAPVVARELRLVRVRRVVQPRAGEQLTLALIRRNRISIIPQPVDPMAAAAAAAAAGAATAADGSGGGTGTAEPLSLFDRNPFAKFVASSDASELWRAAAEQLAACATELVTEGGIDAALAAPYVYGALDQLAARARRWAEHRAECLAARGLLASREGPGASPEALGAAAEAALKKMFTAAVSEGAATREAVSQRAALDHQFPSLVSRMPVPPAAGEDYAVVSPRAAVPKSGTSGNGAPAAGYIAARATPPLLPPEPQLPFDAVFSEDEADEQSEASGGGGGGGASAQGHQETTTPAQLGLGTPPDLKQGTAPPGNSPPTSADLSGGGIAAPSSGAELLGTSPTTRLNTPGTQGEFYTYQAADGSWIFLHPLNLRCLLHVYGSYDSCPPVITARLLELEDVVQAEVTRRRWRFLSHLPLSGAFKLCEVAMSDLVPPDTLTPFADELSVREKRRRRQRADERRQAAAEAAAAARAAAARLGPSAEELQAMPSLKQALNAGTGGNAPAVGSGGSGAGGGLLAAASAAAAALAQEIQLSPSEVSESIALQVSMEGAAATAAAMATSPGPPGGGGVSFAHITKMGFAATGPALGTSPPLCSIAAAVGTSVAWGTKAAATAGGSGAPSGGSTLPGSPWSGIAPVVPAAGGGAGPWGSGKGGATIKAAAAATSVGAGKGLALGESSADGVAAAGGGSSSSKKGKSGKGMLLFSTGNQRKY